MTATAKRTKQPKPRAPRPGTFAAWVYEQWLQNPNEPPKVVAARARSSKSWPKATAQAVSNARWYYDLQPSPLPSPTVLTDARVAARAARITAARASARQAPAVTASTPPELLRVIHRYGTAATRRAIEHVESYAGAIEVLRGESA